MDYYITANSVSGVRRVTEDVFGLHNIVVDIDCHEEGARSMELLAAFIWRCGRDLWNIDECPEPNSIVFSGRGVQLWWAIEPASAKIQYWYKRMQAWILDALQGVLDEYPEEFSGQICKHTLGRSLQIAAYLEHENRAQGLSADPAQKPQ